jgi:sulfate transport system ATP-binding protein
MTIELRDIAKRFGSFAAVDGVSLRVARGELVALLGPSGSGKTTLLRIIAGLEFADRGAVLLDGEDAGGRDAAGRRVGFVFQHYALFRHMTVFENVAFGLRVMARSRRPAEAAIREKVLALLRLVQLEPMASRYPAQLSGGQRQRIALARALAIEPRVLLLDEPFGALDAKVRKELRRWLRGLHDEMGFTSLFVTHDQEEALELADRVVVMNQGRIEQIGTPQEVYDAPATPFVYEFLGNVNRIACAVVDGKARLWGDTFADGDLRHDRRHAYAYLRPHDIEVGLAPGAQAAEVRHVSTAGPIAKIELAVDGAGGPVEAEISRQRLAELALRPGQRVGIRARAAKVFGVPD